MMLANGQTKRVQVKELRNPHGALMRAHAVDTPPGLEGQGFGMSGAVENCLWLTWRTITTSCFNRFANQLHVCRPGLEQISTMGACSTFFMIVGEKVYCIYCIFFGLFSWKHLSTGRGQAETLHRKAYSPDLLGTEISVVRLNFQKIPRTPMTSIFLKVNLQKEGLFQSKPGSFGFRVDLGRYQTACFFANYYYTVK